MKTKEQERPKTTDTPAVDEAPPMDLSKMSKGKQEALELAEASRDSWEHESFVGNMFMGRFPWRLIHPFPVQDADDRARGDIFLKTLEKFLAEKVDADEIDETGEIPQEVIDELAPEEGEHLVIKKGFGGFGNTRLDTILRNQDITTCVVTGVTTCVCVSTTIRGGVEHNYRMILAGDATAEVNKDAHAAELKTMARVFADVKTTDEVIEMLSQLTG